MINHACTFLNCNGNRDDGIRRLALASNHAISVASHKPHTEEYKKAQSKIALSLRDLMKKTGRNLLDEKVQLCIRVSCCIAYKVNVEIMPPTIAKSTYKE